MLYAEVIEIGEQGLLSIAKEVSFESSAALTKLAPFLAAKRTCSSTSALERW
jgi:hypothetical protein